MTIVRHKSDVQLQDHFKCGFRGKKLTQAVLRVPFAVGSSFPELLGRRFFAANFLQQ
jgi:hypothetical protein